MPKRRLEFLYDGQSRRISKKVMDWNATTSAWVTKDERRFVYDGWNLVAELSASGNLIQSHTWGMDLSGTAQGAGGVGGLLWSNDVGNNQVLFAAYDGNGNVVAMISTSENPAKVKARYDYNAFGATVLQEGDGTLVSNAYRFSTKYQDEETWLYYYGFRYYQPEAGRWLNRDPIGERGGINLYGMVGNDAENGVDVLGLDRWITGIGHPAIYVDQYDQNGNKMDCKTRIDFGPDLGSSRNGAQAVLYLVLRKALSGARGGAYGAALSIAVLEGAIYITPDQVLPIDGIATLKVVRASQDQDNEFLQFMEELKKDQLAYNTLFFNCTHFVNMVAEYPMKPLADFSFTPLTPLQRPGVQAKRIRQEGRYVRLEDDMGNVYHLLGTMPPITKEIDPYPPYVN